MTNLKKSVRGWLPLTLVPLLSVAVLAGCGSDNDPAEETPTIAGDADNNGISDLFEPTAEAPDADDDGIADIFQSPIDADAVAADINENMIDDSYEIAYSGGVDANDDGVDDAAAAALVAAGLLTLPEVVDPGEGEGTGEGEGEGTGEGEGEGTGEGEGEGTGEGEGEGTGEGEGEGTGNTGELIVTLSNGAGTANLDWDGSALTGTVDIEPGTALSSAAIYTGIYAGGNGEYAIGLNGTGNPQYFVPEPMSAQNAAIVADNINSGNLYIGVTLQDGNVANGVVQLPAVKPTYTELTGSEVVPEVTAASTANGFMNLNTETGDLTVVVKVVLSDQDVDATGAQQTVSAVEINTGAAGADGPVIVQLANPSGDQTTWTGMAKLGTGDLDAMLQGDAYMSAIAADGSNFLRGQISVP